MADHEENPGENSKGLITGEIVDALRQDKSGQINVNILVQQVSAKATSADEIVKETRQILQLAQEWEEARVKAFIERADAIIAAKTKDPDEIDKRSNNRVRRCLKLFIASLSTAGVVGGVATALMGGSIAIAGLFLLMGVVGLALLGPLASGESVTASDVVRIVEAAARMVPGGKPQQEQPRQEGRKRR